jgi:hypothetical protein
LAEEGHEPVGRGDFEFIESKPDSFKKQKGHPTGDYEPRKIKYDENEEDSEYRQKRLKDQVKSTAETLNERTLRNDDQVFFVLDFAAPPASNRVDQILNRLQADILAYLNKEHNRVLVAGSGRELFRLYNNLPSYFKDWVHLIRPLTRSEQLSKELSGADPRAKLVLVRIMPNLRETDKRTYLNKLAEFLRQHGAEIYYREITGENGVIVTQTEDAVVQSLVDHSTFVYQVKPAPDAIAVKLKKSHKRKSNLKKKATRQPTRNGDAEPQSLGTNVDPSSLRKIVVLDSGANLITPLQRFIERSNFSAFNDPDDGYLRNGGHGTPISYLAAFGEQNHPAARIISHKIYSDAIRNVAYPAILDGIASFADDGNETRIFVSSIALIGRSEEEINDLDRTVQKKNICLCVAAGNIDVREIENNHRNYPLYLRRHFVMPPAYAPEIVAVGSYSNRVSTQSGVRSIAPVGGIAPHSCCGSGTPLLYDCLKPEVVEHGGNVNIVGTTAMADNSVGVSSFDSSGNYSTGFVGTSFSSPIFARKLAIIDGKYHDRIRNIETLKAIALIQSRRINSPCAGYGEGMALTGCSRHNAIYVSEGEIQLASTSGSSYDVPISKIEKIFVPKEVNRIDICIVHSDNFSRTVAPSLNTYMKVIAFKTGSDSPVPPKSLAAVNQRTNIKFVSYSFKKKSMEAIWSFNLIPDITNSVFPRHRNEIKVRFGCAILLTRSGSTLEQLSLTEVMRNMRESLSS